MSTHSPAPWRDEMGGEYVIKAANGHTVMLIGYERRALPGLEDRRLMLAAPELLAAIEDLMRDAPKCSHEPAPSVCRYCLSRAAIAKAKGVTP